MAPSLISAIRKHTKTTRSGPCTPRCAPSEAVGALSLPGGRKLHVRIGIATGLVVVGDVVGTGDALGLDVAGFTPNLAARLQGQAPPDTVLVAEETRRQVGELFEWRDVGLLTLKGLPEPVRAW